MDRAENLPDTDTALWNIDGKDVTDPYVTCEVGPARLIKTKYIANELNPVWDEKFDVLVCHNANSLRFNVKDKEHIGAADIGSCQIRVEDLLSGETIDGWFDLMSQDQGRLKISVQYVPLESQHSYEMDDVYFEVRDQSRVTLYQDAENSSIGCL